MGFATDAHSCGQEPDPATGAIVAPIYQTPRTSRRAGQKQGLRLRANESSERQALERTVAKRKAPTAPTFSLGHGGDRRGIPAFAPGPITWSSPNVYRRSISPLHATPRDSVWNSASWTPPCRISSQALRPNTKMLYLETPANPTSAFRYRAIFQAGERADPFGGGR